MASLYWITGLPGSGKTTIGRLFFDYLKDKGHPVVFLDGDELRWVLDATDHSYAEDDRKKLSMKYARFCKLLVDQGTNVVCATVSMFHSVRDWNKENIKNYTEIYLKVSQDTLFKRDKNKLYSESLNNNQKNIPGLDLLYEEPLNPQVLISNEGDLDPHDIMLNLTRKLEI